MYNLDLPIACSVNASFPGVRRAAIVLLALCLFPWHFPMACAGADSRNGLGEQLLAVFA